MLNIRCHKNRQCNISLGYECCNIWCLTSRTTWDQNKTSCERSWKF